MNPFNALQHPTLVSTWNHLHEAPAEREWLNIFASSGFG